MKRPSNIPLNSKFLEGTGESAWFHIEPKGSENSYKITRYDVLGDAECQYTAVPDNDEFTFEDSFEISYVSHCMKCTVIQNGKKFIFTKI